MSETHPVADLLELVEDRLTVPVLIDRFDAQDIAGVLLCRPSGESFIGINADQHPVRQRFTLAHEVGHLHLRHQPRVEFSSDLFGSSNDPQEVEANYFAAEFLAPRQAVTAWLEENDVIAAIDAEGVARLALAFGISFPAACYRLERAGAIDTSLKEKLVQELKASGGEYARRHGDARLTDALESIWQTGTYPRRPRQTVVFAKRAHHHDLIDGETYKAIAGDRDDGQDISSWFT